MVTSVVRRAVTHGLNMGTLCNLFSGGTRPCRIKIVDSRQSLEVIGRFPMTISGRPGVKRHVCTVSQTLE